MNSPPPSPAVQWVDVDAGHAGQRVDNFLLTYLKGVPKSLIYRILRTGEVRRNGGRVKAQDRLEEGDRLRIPPVRTPERDTPVIPVDALRHRIESRILFEDEDLIVIDKPAGLVVHPASGHPTGTLVNALLAHCGASLSGVGGVKRPGIVHRLDKDTSGLLVVAKNDRAHQGLAAQFADHGRTGPLVRTYSALVWGVPDRKTGTIDAPLDRSSTHRDRMAVVRAGKGREAITHYEIEARFAGELGTPVAALVACQLETGRTHQIRVHKIGRAHV